MIIIVSTSTDEDELLRQAIKESLQTAKSTHDSKPKTSIDKPTSTIPSNNDRVVQTHSTQNSTPRSKPSAQNANNLSNHNSSTPSTHQIIKSVPPATIHSITPDKDPQASTDIAQLSLAPTPTTISNQSTHSPPLPSTSPAPLDTVLSIQEQLLILEKRTEILEQQNESLNKLVDTMVRTMQNYEIQTNALAQRNQVLEHQLSYIHHQLLSSKQHSTGQSYQKYDDHFTTSTSTPASYMPFSNSSGTSNTFQPFN